LNGLSWEFGEIVASGLSDSIQTVQIGTDDVGFRGRCRHMDVARTVTGQVLASYSDACGGTQ
jgi:hypothetical protein